ncbi:hypothetical protein CS063_11730 [Sporanaerobium hydrogeniformans]|uniref:Uncharacterized protein n=1 Tax=Sporanaerobium hydrogeniformans TaxID=3072179 RepID=A0AC61DA91_9FIRM|nr:S-layer homology domain-containing protein [Sporanaerobium hydrogeniformans]PHV70140.1 hypothetical protein CS063_11730 [Sporanaerobium hydrogeniformans]
MKKIITVGLVLMLAFTPVSAAEGEMGYFGGVSSGKKMSTLTAQSQVKKNTVSKYTLPYKEVVYLSGKPEVVEGTITINPGKGVDKDKGIGDYTESYIVSAQNKDKTASVSRSVSFKTQYVYDAERRQTVKTSTISKWTENVLANGQSYQLKAADSTYSKSILEHYAPGVTYYRGDIDYTASYTAGEDTVTVTVEGPIYGYEQAFAKTETQKRTITIQKGEDGEGYTVYETPTITAYKDITYGANEPDAISFAGNYKELIRSEGVLNYELDNPHLYEDERMGSLSVQSAPIIDQLSVRDIPSMLGHPARTDVSKAYSLKLFTEEPDNFSPNQVVTREEYITMLVKALQMPLPEIEKKSSKKVVEQSPFTDVDLEDSFYPYAKAAYDAGLIGGGRVNRGSYLTREAMYVLNIRAMGLERLGIGTAGNYTPFVDDNVISPWAKNAIYAASKIGLITVNNGYIFPTKKVTKAECATFLNQFLNYLRYDLQKDYNEKMLLG